MSSGVQCGGVYTMLVVCVSMVLRCVHGAGLYSLLLCIVQRDGVY